MNGQQIRTIRRTLGLSQCEFAQQLGVGRRTVIRWESDMTTPDKEIQQKLSHLDKKVTGGCDRVTENVTGDRANVTGKSDRQDENVTGQIENVTGKSDRQDENVTGDTPKSDTPTKNVTGGEVTGDTEIVSNEVVKVVNYENIPSELKELNQWVCWKYENRNGKMTKPPISAITGRHASNTTPTDWTSFEKAKTYYESHDEMEGIGFVFSDDDPICGIDLDNCIEAMVICGDKPACKEIKEWANELIERFDSYTEFSPSGKGIHVILIGKKKGKAAHRKDAENEIEIYDTGRYFTITGNVVNNHMEIEKKQEELDKLYDSLFTQEEKKTKQAKPKAVSLDDQSLIEKAKNAKDGAKFTALWEGDISGYDSQSEADLALCCLLAFWTGGDYNRIDKLFRQSGLYRDKWGREDYRDMTISAAIEKTTEFYDPNYDDGKTPKSKEKSEQRRINAQGILSEISLFDEPTPEKIHTKLWDFVIDASYWTPAELGRFCDKLNVDYRVTKTWLRGWKRAVITEKRKRSAKAQSRFSTIKEGEKPMIVVSNRFMREITDDIIAAINQVNTPKPFIFVRSSLPTRVELDENGNAIAKPLTVAAARGIMERAANFMSETDIEGETLQAPVNPPLDNVNDFLSLGSFPDLPPLVGISTAPVVAPDGTICMEEGYQPSVRYFYHAKEKLEIGDIIPTPENVEKAKRLILDELYCDFPFADQASRANTIALMLTPFVRPLIQGATPLHTIDASTPGTGKTLLADIASMPFISSGPTIMTAGRDDDEWRKRITAKLMNAPSHILIDNVKNKLTSGDLSAALTAHEWEDRILGQSATIRLPVKCTWIATGNNLELSDEIVRRSVWIRLEANVERPWERRGFKHEDLRGWVQKHRGELVTALLTLVQRWLADGKPEENDVILGGYEEWVKVIGGILKVTGIDGFLENATMLYEQLDVERQTWVEFFSVWAEQYGAYDIVSNSWGAYVETDSGAQVVEESAHFRPLWEKRNDGGPVGTKELFPLASHLDDTPNEGLGILDAYLGRGKERARKVNLGRQLQKHKGRIFGGYKLEILSTKRKRTALYQLTRTEGVSGVSGQFRYTH